MEGSSSLPLEYLSTHLSSYIKTTKLRTMHGYITLRKKEDWKEGSTPGSSSSISKVQLVNTSFYQYTICGTKIFSQQVILKILPSWEL